MENFNPEKYRKNLKDALHTTRKVDPKKAEEILEEAKESIEYKEAEKHQSEKRAEKQEVFYHKNKIEAKSEEQLRKEIEDNYNQLQKVTGDKNPMGFEKKAIEETMRSGIENGIESMEALKNLDKNLRIIIDGGEKFENDTSIFYKKTSEKSIRRRTYGFEYGNYFDDLKSIGITDKGGLRESTYIAQTPLFVLLKDVVGDYQKLANILENSNTKSSDLNKRIREAHVLLQKAYAGVIRIYKCWDKIDEKSKKKLAAYQQLEGDVETLTKLIKESEVVLMKHKIINNGIDLDNKGGYYNPLLDK